ncbi:unnamed protein product [Closterium sp. NIES-54]
MVVLVYFTLPTIALFSPQACSPGGLWAHSDPLLNKPFYPNEATPRGGREVDLTGLESSARRPHQARLLTCGISNALDGSEDGLAMAHRRSQLTAEVDVDDSIIADGFFGNNCHKPESDEEE